MTVQETKAKEVLNNIWDFVDAQDEEKGDVVDDAIIEAIGCMEELEQYRALGTVEGFKSALDSSLEYYCLFKEYKAKCKEYAELGTVEELKEAREKQIPKKPLEKEVLFDGIKELACVCSVCESEVGLYKGQPYCENCGNRVDWKEGGTSD